MRVSLTRRAAFALSLVAVVGLALAACSSSGPAPTPSTTSSPTPTFAVPTKSFRSAVLGVSFRYPAYLRLPPGGLFFVEYGFGNAAFNSGSAEVTVQVKFAQPTKHTPPLPFRDAGSRDLATLRSDEGSILHTGLVRIDGLCLAEVEYMDPSPTGAWHRVIAVSAGCFGNYSRLRESVAIIDVGCDDSQWPAQRANLLATLASVRFTRPKG
jgi:hypothetical protein